jgi:hypothetical protein
MNLFVNNQGKFQTNPSVRSINTRNKRHHHRPVASLSCFQKSAFFSSIRILNILPYGVTNIQNEKARFKAALRMYLNAHCFYSVDEFLMCTDTLTKSPAAERSGSCRDVSKILAKLTEATDGQDRHNTALV